MVLTNNYFIDNPWYLYFKYSSYYGTRAKKQHGIYIVIFEEIVIVVEWIIIKKISI